MIPIRRRLTLAIATPIMLSGVLMVSAPSVADAVSAKKPMALGVYLPGVPGTMAPLAAFTSKTGRAPAIVHYFQN